MSSEISQKKFVRHVATMSDQRPLLYKSEWRERKGRQEKKELNENNKKEIRQKEKKDPLVQEQKGERNIRIKSRQAKKEKNRTSAIGEVSERKNDRNGKPRTL